MTQHLRFIMQAAPFEHPQEVMKKLGITYQFATSQSMHDQWWFWNCENCPVPLPPFLAPLELSPLRAIGNGLTPKMAADIVDRERELVEKLPEYQQRVVTEKAELDEKLFALNGFIARSPRFKALSERHQSLLIAAKAHMEGCSDILAEILALFKQGGASDE